MKRVFSIALAAAFLGLHFAPTRRALGCDVYNYNYVRPRLERSSPFHTTRETYLERSKLYKKEDERKRYQLAYNKLGPVVVQYAHNLLVQAAKDPNAKIILPRGEGTLTYEAILALLNRTDSPYGSFDTSRVLLVDMSQELIQQARLGKKWGDQSPTDLIALMLQQKGVTKDSKLIWAGVWDNGEMGAEFAYLKEVSDKIGVGSSDQRLMLVSPGALSPGVGSICLQCGNNAAFAGLFKPASRDALKFHLVTLTGRAQGDPIPYQLKLEGKTVVAVTEKNKTVDGYTPFTAPDPKTGKNPVVPVLTPGARDAQRELGVTDLARAVSYETLKAGEHDEKAADNPAIRRLTTHYGNFLNLLVPTRTKLSDLDPETPTDWAPGDREKLKP